MKLGAILKSFPVEWDVGSKRRRQIIQLTKQIFAAALSIEADQKVRKTITINIALDASDENENLSDLRELDLSGACGSDAYWARCDFFETDFFQADLGATSFRRSSLEYAQFREADLQGAVFDESKCVETNFTSSDLRRATFVDAVLDGANFDQAKVFGVEVRRAKSIKNLKGHLVDCSAEGDGSILVPIEKWIEGSEA